MVNKQSLLDHASGAQGAFQQIPVIDLRIDQFDDATVRQSIAMELRAACIGVGFFYVKNHGLDQDLIDAVQSQARKYFDLPLEEKIKLDIHKSDNFKGYTALLGENTDPENRGDMHEGFDIGWEDPADSSASAPAYTGAMSGGNVWPEGVPNFKNAMMNYYHGLISLGKKLFRLFALALDLPETFFDDKITRPAAVMRILHYPPQTGTVDDRVIGIGAHTDYECFTILWQDAVPALQVLNTKGQWVDALPIPGTFVINIGDQLARWTNDVFKSTRHRAINRTGIERYSMPLFFGTDYDVKLEALPTCVSAEKPAKYEVITAGDYVKSRLEETYAHSKTE